MKTFWQRLDYGLQAPIRWFTSLSETVQDRLAGLILFVPSAIVLSIALYLTPDPSGMGTHRQLGLGSCTILTLTGFPCPMCGMTTTFTHLAHFQVIEGVVNQPFGPFLFMMTVVAFVVGGLDLVSPGRRWKRMMGWVERRELYLAYGLLGGMLLGWVYKISMVKGWFPW